MRAGTVQNGPLCVSTLRVLVVTRPKVEKRPNGRPPHAPTEESRRLVSVVAGAGMLHEEIAVMLGISQPTMRKHYEDELSMGAYARRAEVLAALYGAAVKGNATAARAYLAIVPGAAVPPADPDPVPTKADPKLGKKEQAQVDAKTAQQGTDWADLLPRQTTAQ